MCSILDFKDSYYLFDYNFANIYYPSNVGISKLPFYRSLILLRQLWFFFFFFLVVVDERFEFANLFKKLTKWCKLFSYPTSPKHLSAHVNVMCL